MSDVVKMKLRKALRESVDISIAWDGQKKREILEFVSANAVQQVEQGLLGVVDAYSIEDCGFDGSDATQLQFLQIKKSQRVAQGIVKAIGDFASVGEFVCPTQ